MQDRASTPTVGQIVEETMDLGVGATTALMPALLLAMPGIVLLGLAFIPLAVVGLVVGLLGAVVAGPILLVRKLLRPTE